MSAITGATLNPLTHELDFKARLGPKIKPEVNRVPANPFFPTGQIANEPEATVEKFQSNLPGRTSLETKKVGTVLDTLA